MKVYIISTCDTNWAAQLEITHATLSPDKAKEIIKKIITDGMKDFLDAPEYDIDDDDMPTQKDIDDFANDMVDGNKHAFHCCDEFPGVRIWVDVQELE